jgi:hypothetical protein
VMGVTSLNRSVSFPPAPLVSEENGSHVMDVHKGILQKYHRFC